MVSREERRARNRAQYAFTRMRVGGAGSYSLFLIPGTFHALRVAKIGTDYHRECEVRYPDNLIGVYVRSRTKRKQLYEDILAAAHGVAI